MKLGVCYYPEQWPESQWSSDAQQMAALGIKVVRVGEFSWSRIEPSRGSYSWDWLDRAIALLAAEGLQVVLGTPTATPPKWLVDEAPDILAVDKFGHPRKFGSRRHYCFSSRRYREECRQIVSAMAQRYAKNPAIIAWQTDNEFGCHETTVSYSKNAVSAFRGWLEQRYGSIEVLNRAWGSVFWSQEYQTFDQVDPPAATVTEANPAHRLDYRRFASDEVVSFNRIQVDILKEYAPHTDVIHNFMGFFTEFDHHAVGRDLDISSWDSYPLGFLEQGWFSDEEKLDYLRQGHPDFAAFRHDLYRGCSEGRLWVMEQQPGPVNWAPHNPSPLPGMVRTWTWEAFAHGAEVVSYFRWRQAPFAQEQMHAGLHLPNGEQDVAAHEALQVAQEVERYSSVILSDKNTSPVALVFTYESEWITEIQPQGKNFSCFEFNYACYTALRELGLDVDIVSADAPLEGYSLVVCPCIPHVNSVLRTTLMALQQPVLLGPRSASKTESFQIPEDLPPGSLQSLIPIVIKRVESLRPGAKEKVTYREKSYRVERWLEWIDSSLTPLASTDDGKGIWFSNKNVHYLATWPDRELLREVILRVCEQAGLETEILPKGIRTRRIGNAKFIFNYNKHKVTLDDNKADNFILGDSVIPAGGLAAIESK